MKSYLSIPNWDDLQHYKDRTPPWIKLHNELLESYEFECLPDASKAHLLCIWLLASRTNNKINPDPRWIGRKIGANSKVDIDILLKSGFLQLNQPLQSTEQDASKALQSTEQDACTEERRGEREGEQNRVDIMSENNSDSISVLTYLNEICRTKYKYTTKSHIENINGRLADGHTVEDCKLVVDFKFAEWGGDPKMAAYLRPQTLFSTGKFQGYLMAAKTKPVNKTSLHNIKGIDYGPGGSI